MPVTVREEIIKGSGYRITNTSRELRRMFHFEGLTGTTWPGTLVEAYAALGALSPPVTYGSVLPSDSTLIADDFEFLPFLESKTQCRGVVAYHPADFSSVFQPLIRFTGTSREVSTNYHESGQPIKVQYTPPGGTQTIVIGEVSRAKAFGILEIERVEYDDPKQRLVFIDSINSDQFWGQPKWTWCMRDIVVEKLLYTAGAKVRYIMEYDWQTHLKNAAWRDPITGHIPENVTANPDPYGTRVYNGVTVALVNKELNWSALQLPQGFFG